MIEQPDEFRVARLLRIAEPAIAFALSAYALFFHVWFFLHAGPLWRDELSSIHLALKPTWREVWQNLIFDPFPFVHYALLRGWAATIGTSQTSFRIHALFIALLVFLALWFVCRRGIRTWPLLPLVLGFSNPEVVQTGDAVRPYGIAILFTTLAFYCIWKLATAPRFSAVEFIGALLSCVGAAQSAFTNVVFLAGFAAGAIVIALCDRQFANAVRVAAATSFGAATVAVYAPIFPGINRWSVLLSGKVGVADLLPSAIEVAYGSRICWLAAFALLAVVTAATAARAFPSRRMDDDARALIYGAVSVVVAIGGTLAFYIWNERPMAQRYWIGPIMVASLGIQFALGRAMFARIAALAISIVSAVLLAPSTFWTASLPMTSGATAAERVQAQATADDLVFVTTFYFGITFNEYYRGNAPWITLPEIDDHSLHRWDVVKDAVQRREPLRDLLARFERTLRSGHRLYLVGALPAPIYPTPEIAPAPDPLVGWSMPHYISVWQLQIAAFLADHVEHGEDVMPGLGGSERKAREVMGVFVVSGWRD